jgi:ATP synthase protein I
MSAGPVRSDREAHRLAERVERQVRRMERAEREKHGVLRDALRLGGLGLVLVLPVVLGAYLGRWIDGFFEGYSMRWTLSLITVGLVVGAVNVYLLLRE